MIREETYHRIANEFGVGVGVAEWEGQFYPHYTNVQKMPDEMKVIALTNFMIREEVYQQTIREVIRLEKKYANKRIKKSTIYEKAINNVMEQIKTHSII
uniref:Uncharacterized protein n=1 Tax=uncultured Caudovirales phage TaxID=2100421 RepID=A0A6J7X2C9_9CAUD|nr:hypothetical protein UFOVP385_21 [uncultured Caudovirales phage]